MGTAPISTAPAAGNRPRTRYRGTNLRQTLQPGTTAVRQIAFSLFEPARPPGRAPYLDRPRPPLELPSTPRVQIALLRLGRRPSGAAPDSACRLRLRPPIPVRAIEGKAERSNGWSWRAGMVGRIATVWNAAGRRRCPLVAGSGRRAASGGGLGGAPPSGQERSPAALIIGRPEPSNCGAQRTVKGRLRGYLQASVSARVIIDASTRSTKVASA